MGSEVAAALISGVSAVVAAFVGVWFTRHQGASDAEGAEVTDLSQEESGDAKSGSRSPTISDFEPFHSGSWLPPSYALTPGQFITSENGDYRFCYQQDGDLVLRSGDKEIWSSATRRFGRPGFLAMQDDGNLVIYRWDGRPVWDSGTWGAPGNSLVVQDDGNVVIYGTDSQSVWDTQS